jgi:acyl-CoA synthetase (AMP-forming)/AMP-acid ligase II/thioesterase domain-containing protein
LSAASVYGIIDAHAKSSPDAIAVAAPGRPPLTYGDLQQHINAVVDKLNSLGIGRNDRVAIVLPNGPEMAVSFLSVASCATSAPLNPAYRTSEFDFYLTDLNARALITLAGASGPALESARAKGIALIELSPLHDQPAGLFALEGTAREPDTPTGVAGPDDTALILHTSGTTSRPKIVPLTQRNICASAEHIRATLELTQEDRCLNVMPLFHIHGLIGATLSTFAAGASIVCTPGFDESRFFEWMRSHKPTWYTAVPTMHQSVLARAGENREVVADTPLRFIRSSSSSLPPQVMIELEKVFHAPVIESYGMTEASHQMASNPLPPRTRKPGSVGVAAGPEVSIMNAQGEFLPQGSPGEIVIRGPNVTNGYENNPSANEGAFTNGWFRTGDQGYMDEEAYLFITGRLKEIINRGGEKIMPREVDEAFMDHQAVAQAVTFAVPHLRLGEDVAAAVVLAQGAVSSERELREFARSRLADHKVPTRVLVVETIPKGPTGKLQRIGLAEKLADQLKTHYEAPRNLVEEKLAGIWANALGVSQVGIQDNFFSLGGDSLLASRVLAEIHRVFRSDLPLSTAFQAPTIEQLAIVIDQEARAGAESSLVQIQDGETRSPLFYLPGTAGNVFGGLGAFAWLYGPGRRVYGIEERLGDPSSIQAQAVKYHADVRRVQPEGPYYLVGSCSGGAVAFEMAKLFHADGQRVALLAMVEPTPPYLQRPWAYMSFGKYLWDRLTRRLDRQIGDFSGRSSAERGSHVRRKLKNIARQWAIRRHIPHICPGQIHLFLTPESLHARRNSRVAWRDLASEGAIIHEIPGTHISVVGSAAGPANKSHLEVIARELKKCIADTLPES